MKNFIIFSVIVTFGFCEKLSEELDFERAEQCGKLPGHFFLCFWFKFIFIEHRSAHIELGSGFFFSKFNPFFFFKPPILYFSQ